MNAVLAQLDQLARIGVGASAPGTLKAQATTSFGTDLALGNKTFPVKNAVFRSIETGDRRGILLMDQRYVREITSAIGRDDRKVGQALVQDFFRKNGLRAVQVSPYEYRLPYTAQLYKQAERYFMGVKKMENHACCGHPGRQFTFQGLSGTVIDFLPNDPLPTSSVTVSLSNH